MIVMRIIDKRAATQRLAAEREIESVCRRWRSEREKERDAVVQWPMKAGRRPF